MFLGVIELVEGMDIYQANREKLFGPESSIPSTQAVNVGELPESYGENILVLLPVDPGKVYCYWDLSFSNLLEGEGERQALAKRLGLQPVNLLLHLRLYSQLPAKSELEWVTGPQTRSTYISCNWQDAAYTAELGFVDRAGAFMAMVRSNLIGASANQEPCLQQSLADPPTFYQPVSTPKYSLHSLSTDLLHSPSVTTYKYEWAGSLDLTEVPSTITRECEERFTSGLSSWPSLDHGVSIPGDGEGSS